MPDEEVPTPRLVLIVEDEEPIAEALEYIVEDHGYEVLIAQHGKQALELLREHHPELIITDLMMPQMNGAELIAEIRAAAECNGQPPVPVVLMTAAGGRYSAGVKADATLPKPFDIEQVDRVLRRFLELAGPD
jgi:CheY-like chemotaxis protein